MTIPAFNADGLLPPGVHEATFDEVRSRFGAFQASDRRVRLFDRLTELVENMRLSGLFQFLLIDGSFVTTKPAPNDIDLLAVLKPGHDFERDLPISEYALVSRAMLARRFRFDVIVAEQDSEVYKTFVEFFSRLRNSPELRKGMVRVTL